jgi:hypothetical protein
MLPFRFTGKELDEETGLYYYGARYLDPRVSRWLSADPAMGDYIPAAPVNEETRKHNGNLPGMGGIYNWVNLHAYHYAGNNPVKYIDPDGMWLANNTDSAIIIRTEDGKYELLKSGGTYYGKVDGALMQDGTIIKITDTSSFDTKIAKTDIIVKTNAVDVIINQNENGEYTFDLPGVHSKVINSLGDLLKNLSGDLKSGIYKADERPEVLKSWWDQATSSGPNGYGDPATWSTQIFEKTMKELEN